MAILVPMWKIRTAALALLAGGILVGYFAYQTDGRFPYRFGLDLSGGTHLLYRADTSSLPAVDRRASLESLRDVIERRTNIFGVSEPLVQLERSSALSEVAEDRLIVELPGVTDIAEAVRVIGETPTLEFKLVKKEFEDKLANADGSVNAEAFAATGLTGRLLASAQLQFGSGQTGQLANEPIVAITFNSEGADLFEKITGEHVGELLAIFLDGAPISTPVIREAIPGGKATISGDFTPDAAKKLVRDLNFGALPVPIELISTQSIGASLGEVALGKGIAAALVGSLLVAGFMVLWYRVPGLLATIALSLYITLMLAVFKLIPVTLTAAGIAGFILSIGMAVDANVLIFERFKEEFARGKGMEAAVKEGFARAWLSIRDGHLSSIITAVILFWFGTSLVKGFALTFGLGVIMSLITAISVSRTFLRAFGNPENRGIVKFLFGSGTSL